MRRKWKQRTYPIDKWIFYTPKYIKLQALHYASLISTQMLEVSEIVIIWISESLWTSIFLIRFFLHLTKQDRWSTYRTLMVWAPCGLPFGMGTFWSSKRFLLPMAHRLFLRPEKMLSLKLYKPTKPPRSYYLLFKQSILIWFWFVNFSVLRVILESSPELLTKRDEATGNTCLHVAQYKTPLASLLQMKHEELDLNAKNKSGLAPIHLFTNKGDLGIYIFATFTVTKLLIYRPCDDSCFLWMQFEWTGWLQPCHSTAFCCLKQESDAHAAPSLPRSRSKRQRSAGRNAETPCSPNKKVYCLYLLLLSYTKSICFLLALICSIAWRFAMQNDVHHRRLAAYPVV